MAARQLGYYHAVIEKTEQTRLRQIREAGGEPELPPIDGLERLWEAWQEAGMTTGGAALHWSEIEAYGRITGLARDEMIMLYRMSSAYLDGMSLTHPLAKDPVDAQS